MYNLNLRDSRAILKRYLSAQLPVMIWGAPGIGKSSLIQQIGEDTNRNVIDLRLSQIEFSDLRGIPYIDKNDTLNISNVKWSIPNFLPINSDDNSILFLDELNLAHPSIMAAAYQLILDRKIGDYVLPAKTSIIAAGNRSSESSHVNDIPLPLLNRFVHMTISSEPKVWLEYAKENIHPLIVAFITKSPSHLNIKDYTKATEAYNTPRTWEYASKILKTFEHDLTDHITFKKYTKEILVLLQGTIGEEAATAFVEFVKKSYNKSDLDLKRIYTDSAYKITRELNSVDILYVATNLMVMNPSMPSDAEINYVNNSLQFVYDNSEIELYLAYTRELSSRDIKIGMPMFTTYTKIMRHIKENHSEDVLAISNAIETTK
jgi:MoxR-like ATPase